MPPRLQDRLQAARTLIDEELNDLVELRMDINRMSDALLSHILVLRNCYVTVGTFARRGLSSTAKTLRSLSGVRGSEY